MDQLADSVPANRHHSGLRTAVALAAAPLVAAAWPGAAASGAPIQQQTTQTNQPASKAPTPGQDPFAPVANFGGSGVPWADPDSIPNGVNGNYVTVGTTLEWTSPCGDAQGLYPKYNVPYNRSIGTCIEGDALPYGAGDWAMPGSHIWAPSVIRSPNGVYVMHYSAQKSVNQWCIGRAVSTKPEGPYIYQTEWACPGAGRWAIDPDAFISNGTMYVAYRDDAIAQGQNTGLSVVQADQYGAADWTTRRDLLLGSDVSWNTAPSTGVDIVENPSMWLGTNGHYYLSFSGNQYDATTYATGVAERYLALACV